jgi:hypothetical protein
MIKVTIRLEKKFNLPEEDIMLPCVPDEGAVVSVKAGMYTVKRVVYDVRRPPCRVFLELE